jgi:hypothetical protein
MCQQQAEIHCMQSYFQLQANTKATPTDQEIWLHTLAFVVTAQVSPTFVSWISVHIYAIRTMYKAVYATRPTQVWAGITTALKWLEAQASVQLRVQCILSDA